MRELNIGSKEHTVIHAVDEPSFGGACHLYRVFGTKILKANLGMANALMSEIQFQYGPIKEHGVNGVHHEDLIAIVIDRLQCFQSGDYACNENKLAIDNLQLVLAQLSSRTDKRKAAGIEGTSKL